MGQNNEHIMIWANYVMDMKYFPQETQLLKTVEHTPLWFRDTLCRARSLGVWACVVNMGYIQPYILHNKIIIIIVLLAGTGAV